MNKLYALITILLSILNSSCLTPIDGGQGFSNEGIVIEGLVTNQTEESYVKLSSLDVQDNTLIQTPIENASVSILEDETTKIQLTESTLGKYLTPSTFIGNVGSTYSLNITLESGQTIFSNFETLHPAVEIDTIEVSFLSLPGEKKEEDFLDFFIKVRQPVKQSLFRLKCRGIAETSIEIIPPLPECMGERCIRPCWSYRNPINRDRIPLYDTDSFLESEANLLFAARDPYDYHARYYFDVKAYALSPAGYDYWNSLKQQLDLQGSLLDPKLPDLPTNLRIEGSEKPVFGYFGASAVTSQSVIFRRSDVGGFVVSTPVASSYRCRSVWRGGVEGVGFTPEEFL